MGTLLRYRGRMILVGIAVIGGCSQKSSEPAPTTGSAATVAAPKAAISGREQPTLADREEPAVGSAEAPAPAVEAPRPVPANPTATPGTEFERQTRDPAWAGRTENEIKKRAKKVGAEIDAAECRHDRCLLSLRGSEEQVADVIAKLESPEGLQGFAQSIYLTAPIEKDGKLVMRAYATFDR